MGTAKLFELGSGNVENALTAHSKLKGAYRFMASLHRACAGSNGNCSTLGFRLLSYDALPFATRHLIALAPPIGWRV